MKLVLAMALLLTVPLSAQDSQKKPDPRAAEQAKIDAAIKKGAAFPS